MTTTINASNSGSGGLIQTADASGILALQTAGTTAVTINASQNATFAGTLATAAKGITAASLPAGSVIQVVQSTTTSTASNGANNNVTATGLSVTITPTSATNKILVFCNWGWSCSTIDFGYYAFRINSVLETTSTITVFNQSATNATNSLYMASLSKLYSPGNTSAQTYELVFYNGNAPTQTSYFNQRGIGGASGLCTITAMEIAA
jgi:hypothetical protein